LIPFGSRRFPCCCCRRCCCRCCCRFSLHGWCRRGGCNRLRRFGWSSVSRRYSSSCSRFKSRRCCRFRCSCSRIVGAVFGNSDIGASYVYANFAVKLSNYIHLISCY
jgi:hypothetical protein